MKKITSRTHHTNKPPIQCGSCCNFFTAKRGRPLPAQKYCSKLCHSVGQVKKPHESEMEFLGSFDVDDVTGCWVWNAGRASFGYGALKSNQKRIRAHRFSYERSFGEIPKGMIVRHSCDNPPCVNPAHLELGTMRDNTRDMMKRGRAKFFPGSELKGEAHPLSKITPEIAKMIFGAMGKHADIAAIFHVSPSLVGGIKRGTHWKHVTSRI